MTDAERIQKTPGSICAECGMLVDAGEYHPFAACLMYRGCLDVKTVRNNLPRRDTERIQKLTDALDWYADKAEAVFRYQINHYNETAIEGVMTELYLDRGQRAKEAKK